MPRTAPPNLQFSSPDWDGVPRFGYSADVAATEQFTETLARPRLATHCQQLLRSTKQKDVNLWIPLLENIPGWKRGAQGIGDCVSWGWEAALTLILHAEYRRGNIDLPLTTAATESIYGGSRVEARDGRLGGYGDGSYGAAAAKWVTDWGCILRLDYSDETGIGEHNLETYSSKKAKEWGNFGCGGKDDAGREDGKLDTIAKEFPCFVSRVLTTVEAVAAITNGYPIPVCSSVGFGNMKRNSDGVVRAKGSWNHCMAFIGLRWVSGKPQFRLLQSWGNSCSGPDPGIEHDAISQCSWWIVEEDAARILKARDSFAVSRVEGFPPQKLDWAEAAGSWKPGGEGSLVS